MVVLPLINLLMHLQNVHRNLKMVGYMIKKMAVTRYRRFKDFIPSNHRWILLILTVLAAVPLPHSVQAYDFQGCNDCHMETLDKDGQVGLASQKSTGLGIVSWRIPVMGSFYRVTNSRTY